MSHGQPGWIDEALARARAAEPSGDRPSAAASCRWPTGSSRCSTASTGPGGARPKVREERITMSHGAGGKATHTLIEAVFLDAFRNPLLEPLEDAARWPSAAPGSR